MNVGTKIRTALRIAVSLNTAIYAVSAAIGTLGFGWLTTIWAIFTIISDFAVSALTTYYNNDYTEEGCIGTGVTRQLKKEKEDGYIGDSFFGHIDEFDDEDDEIEPKEDSEVIEEEFDDEEIGETDEQDDL